MPKGIPKRGYRRTKKLDAPSLEEVERRLALRVPDIISELEKLTKPFSCPHCGNEIRVIDKDVGMYLIDRVMGKPKQRTEVDITQTIVLNADQIDTILINHLPQIVSLYEHPIRALLMEGNVQRQDEAEGSQ